MLDFLAQVRLAICRRLLTYLLATLSISVGVAAYLCTVALAEADLQDTVARAARRDPLALRPSFRIQFGTMRALGGSREPMVRAEPDDVAAQVRQVTGRGVAMREEYRADAKYGRWALPGVIVFAVSANTFGEGLMGRGRVARGRGFTPEDEFVGRAVCTIPEGLYDRLAQAGEPLGRAVRLAGRQVQIVGVEAEEDEVGFHVPTFTVPLSTARRLLQGIRPEQVSLSALSTERDLLTHMDRVEAMLNAHTGGSYDWRAARRAERERRDDVQEHAGFAMWSPHYSFQDLLAGQRRTRLLLGLLATLSLSAGLLGMVSMLLANLANRTYEIGLHRALGATRLGQAMEVLCEAALTGLFGGLIGIVLGSGILRALVAGLGYRLPVEPGWLLAALTASTLSALLAGLIPARAAMRISLAQSLRAL